MLFSTKGLDGVPVPYRPVSAIYLLCCGFGIQGSVMNHKYRASLEC